MGHEDHTSNCREVPEERGDGTSLMCGVTQYTSRPEAGEYTGRTQHYHGTEDSEQESFGPSNWSHEHKKRKILIKVCKFIKIFTKYYKNIKILAQFYKFLQKL